MITGVASMLLASALSTQAATAGAPRPEGEGLDERVVLLHGLARGPGSMGLLADRLTDAGFEPVVIGYPSTAETPESLVAHVQREVAACCAAADPLHFVTFSLGSLLVRALIADHRPAGLGRVVMLGPPNQGSEWVDEVGGWSAFEWLGPTAAELGTGPDSFPNRLGPPDFPVGVIAGTRQNPISASVIPGGSDGTVGVERTRLPGMADFITVPRTHTFLTRSEGVAAEAAHFLRHGRFSDEATRPPTDAPRVD